MRIVERPVERRGIRRAAGARAADRDLVVAEEPLEIRIGGESLIVTMRTPGDDLDLAAGLLFTEGVIASMDDVAALAHGGADGRPRSRERRRRHRGARAGAGGRRRAARAARDRRLRAVRQGEHRGRPKADRAGRRSTRASRSSVVLGLPEAIRAAQPVFAATGGLHAVGLFTPDGALLLVREDVGRHNAVDKVIGAELRAGAPRWPAR